MRWAVRPGRNQLHLGVGLGLALLLGACGPSPEDIAANLASDNPVVREDSAKMAKKYDDEVVIQALIVALNDPGDTVRLNAVESLAELEAVEAVPSLIAVVQADSDPEVVSAAVDALGRIADPRAVSVLMAHLEQHGPELKTLNAIWALGNIGDGRALPLLARIRAGTDDVYVIYNVDRAMRLLKPLAEAEGTEEPAPDGADLPAAPDAPDDEDTPGTEPG